mgnify:CR=1 FL=1
MLNNGPHVLLVADCDGLEDSVRDLNRHGFEAESAKTASDAMERYGDFDVLLIDLELQDFDGLTLAQRIRTTSDIPMIACTPPVELDRVLALEAGCDDCVDKPYHSRELVARIGALLRRVTSYSTPSLVFGDLSIFPSVREVRLLDHNIEMTRKEFDLLHLLASEPDRVFSRVELLRRVWDYQVFESEVSPLVSRTIDTHVSTVRRKLGSPNWIVTVRGVGFRFNDEADCSP